MTSCFFLLHNKLYYPNFLHSKKDQNSKSSCAVISHRCCLGNRLQNYAVQVDVLRTRGSKRYNFSNIIRSQGGEAFVHLKSTSNSKCSLQHNCNLLGSERVSGKAHDREFGFYCTGGHISHADRFAVEFQPHRFTECALRVLAACVT